MDPAETLRTLRDITALDEATCENLLAAAGGDLELAMTLFSDEQQHQQSAQSAKQTPTGPDALIFSSLPAPKSWAEQGFVSLKGTMNVLQPLNGPCGIIACLLAEIAVIRLEAPKRNEVLRNDSECTPDEIRQAVFRVLSRCGPTVKFGGKIVKKWTELTTEQVSRKGCLVDLVRAIVDTKTPELLKKEVESSHGELPLVVGSHALCGSELVSLMIRGNANGNFSCVSPTTGIIVEDKEWSACGYGMLARASNDAQPPIANGLKFPRHPIWVLHGGDHFTVLIEIDHDLKRFLHLNGLPPAGPSSTIVTINYTEDAPRVTEKLSTTFAFIKRIPGEIDDIIQAHPEDKEKFPGEWKKWRYECVLAVYDPSVTSTAPERPKDQIKIFTLGDEPKVNEKFRCAGCYRDRYRLWQFGEQTKAPGQTTCSFCHKPLKDVGWSLWFAYDELPRSVQRMASRMFAPKFLNVVRTRWPDADVVVQGPMPST